MEESVNLYKFFESLSYEDYHSARSFVLTHKFYSPYSSDLGHLHQLIREEKFQEVIDYSTLNTILSPRAHFIKSDAYRSLGELPKADVFAARAFVILNMIDCSGQGTVVSPYQILRVEDENDLLSYKDEELESQNLIHQNDKAFDVIRCESGRELVFDITKIFSTLT